MEHSAPRRAASLIGLLSVAVGRAWSGQVVEISLSAVPHPPSAIASAAGSVALMPALGLIPNSAAPSVPIVGDHGVPSASPDSAPAVPSAAVERAPASAGRIGGYIRIAPVSDSWIAALRGYFAAPKTPRSDQHPLIAAFKTMDLDDPRARLQLAPLVAMISAQRSYTAETFNSQSRFWQDVVVNHALNLAVEELSSKAFVLIRASVDSKADQDKLASTMTGLNDVGIFSAFLQPATVTAIEAARAMTAQRLGAMKFDRAGKSMKATSAELSDSISEIDGDPVLILLAKAQGQELRHYWGYDYKPRLVAAMVASVDAGSSVRQRRAVAKGLVREIRRNNLREMHGAVAPEALAFLSKGSSDDRLRLFAIKHIMKAISTRDWVELFYARGVQAVQSISSHSQSEELHAEAARLIEQERTARAGRVYRPRVPPIGEQIRTGFKRYPFEAVVSLGALSYAASSLPADSVGIKFILGAASALLVGVGLWNRRPGLTVGLSIAVAILMGWMN
ncbi:MAG: hypothetical protein ACHQ2Z_09960 [Elusimicrobiota bacterium]